MSRHHLVRGQRVRPVKVQASRDLRRKMTDAERALWDRVRGAQILGLRFRRQQVIAGFIVDFYCHAARLVVETMAMSTLARRSTMPRAMAR